jgi:hypothetical protein
VKLVKIAACGVLVMSMFLTGHVLLAQDDPNNPQVGGQGGSAAQPPGMNNQGGDDDRTLEIAPQPGLQQRKPAVQELPSDRTFQPSDQSASVEPNFQPNSGGDSSRPRHRPSIGITVQYDTQCYQGMEEHGLEVVTVDANSPAQRAGLQPRSGITAVGAAGSTVSGLLGPLNMVLMPVLAKHGALGTGGDLIVAIDDQRVRSQDDLEYALNQLKPGDTMYLTVIRPLPGGNHKTMKVAVTLGDSGVPVASAGDPNGSSSGAENYAH